MEGVEGRSIGLDSENREPEGRVTAFIEQSNIPMLTVNLLQALPRTPLWDRLEREQRLSDDPERESNVVFKMPYEQTVAIWRACLEYAYDPDRLFRRYDYQIQRTYPHRRKLPPRPGQLPMANLKRGLTMLIKVCWKLVLRHVYLHDVWIVSHPLLNVARIPPVIPT